MITKYTNGKTMLAMYAHGNPRILFLHHQKVPESRNLNMDLSFRSMEQMGLRS